jgi:hypothetical protein
MEGMKQPVHQNRRAVAAPVPGRPDLTKLEQLYGRHPIERTSFRARSRLAADFDRKAAATVTERRVRFSNRLVGVKRFSAA